MANYETLLSVCRFAPIGDPMFQGKTGDYYIKVMNEKRVKQSETEHVQASKRLGRDV